MLPCTVIGYLMTCKYTIFASKIIISNPKSFSKMTKVSLMLTLNQTNTCKVH